MWCLCLVRACCPCRSPARSTRPSGRRIARRRVRRALAGRNSRICGNLCVGLGLFSGRGGRVLGHWKFPCFGDKAGGKRCGLIRGAGGLGDLGSIISHGKRGRFFPVRGQGNGLIKVVDTHVGSFQCAPAADSEALGEAEGVGLASCPADALGEGVAGEGEGVPDGQGSRLTELPLSSTFTLRICGASR